MNSTAYERFHGKRPRTKKDFNFHCPRELVVIGKAIAIEYECSKVNGGGDGAKHVYRHEFETPAIVCMDETTKKQLYIIGKKVTVTSKGIEH